MTNSQRTVSEELEKILGVTIPVLDRGFIRVIDYMGDDSSIVQAARVSYGAGTKKTNEDRGLIRYLLRNKHTTPFEMCEIKFHIKLPIFVARQWVRHRTANINEYSARYSILQDDFYIPNPENIGTQSIINKQCRDLNLIQDSEKVLANLKEVSENCYLQYKNLLNIDPENMEILDKDKEGIAREIARVVLPVNFYTQWYWKIDLHNLMHFIKLRSDKHAQYEIREYANVLLEIVEKWVPHTYEAFNDYVINNINLSKHAWQVAKKILSGLKISFEESGLSKTEWNDLLHFLDDEKL